jgi:hypothetical protein
MRKPVELNSQIKALREKTLALQERQKAQWGELVLATGADAMPLEALAGALLAAVKQAGEKPEAVARWAETGEAFFRGDSKPGTRGKGNGVGQTSSATPGHEAPPATGDSPAP